MPYDWFYFDMVKNVSKEKTFHACQIPKALSEMLIKSCTMPNDVVLVLFGGSGSEIEVCKSIGRQFISAELDEKYYELIMDRLKLGKEEPSSINIVGRVEGYLKEEAPQGPGNEADT